MNRPNKTEKLQRLAPAGYRVHWLRDHFELHRQGREPVVLGHAYSEALERLRRLGKQG